MTVEHVEESLDPTKELARLVSEGKLEEAFNKALSRTDVGIVSWLCNQVTTFYILYLLFFVLNLHVMIPSCCFIIVNIHVNDSNHALVRLFSPISVDLFVVYTI